MIRRPIIALLLILLGTGAAVKLNDKHADTNLSPSTAPLVGFQELTIETVDGTRPYLLYIPASLDTAMPASLVFFFHGGGGSMEQAKNYKLQDKADEAGFILVLPNGTGALRDDGILAAWNAGECCGGARDRNINDVDFVRNIVASLQKNLSIDKTRIYATGMSNGGMMSYRLACEAADIFAAVAPVAGTDNTVTCNPSEPISILHIHALDDTHVLYNGGAGEDAFRDETKVTDFTSVNETISRWQSYNNLLSIEPKRVLTVPGAYCDTYQNDNDTEVRLCVTETGGHSWPGSTVGQLRGKSASQAIDANDVIWEFFSQHHK